jgi:hypothetical protein
MVLKNSAIASTLLGPVPDNVRRAAHLSAMADVEPIVSLATDLAVPAVNILRALSENPNTVGLDCAADPLGQPPHYSGKIGRVNALFKELINRRDPPLCSVSDFGGGIHRRSGAKQDRLREAACSSFLDFRLGHAGRGDLVRSLARR